MIRKASAITEFRFLFYVPENNELDKFLSRFYRRRLNKSERGTIVLFWFFFWNRLICDFGLILHEITAPFFCLKWSLRHWNGHSLYFSTIGRSTDALWTERYKCSAHHIQKASTWPIRNLYIKLKLRLNIIYLN